MTGNRMSSLPLTEFCGAYHKVQNSSSRAAAMSTYFHAKCAHAEDAEAKRHRLTPEEQEEVAEWHEPTKATFQSGATLDYKCADTELEVMLTEYGEYTEDPSRAISIGHLDMAWVVDGVAYIADIKKSEFTAEVDSLQLAAYGFAYASKHKCHSFCVGIWAATEGEWSWGPLVTFDDDEALTLWLRIKHAALNVSDEFSMGAHCRKCYGRFRCPAYLYPPENAVAAMQGQSMALMADQEGTSAEQAAALLLLAQRAEDTAKDIIKQLKDRAAMKGPLRDGKGFIYRGSLVRGRETLDNDALAKVVDLKQYSKRGADYERFAWVKEK